MVKNKKLFLIKGQESFLKKKHLEKIKSQYKNNRSNWVDIENYYADEDDVSNITQTASLFPSQDKFKVNVVKNIDELPAQKQKKFLSFLKNLPDRSVMILVTSGKKKNKFIKKIEKMEDLKEINCKPLKGNKLFKWVKKRVNQKGKNISSPAVSLLLEKSEKDLFNIDSELEKLVLYTDKDTITTKEIDLLITKNVHYHVFNLIDKACEKKVGEAMDILQQMFTHNIPVPKIVGALGWQLRRMVRGKILLERENKSPYQVTNILNIPKYFSDKYLSQLANFKLVGLIQACEELGSVDIKIKRSHISDELALQNFILRLSG